MEREDLVMRNFKKKNTIPKHIFIVKKTLITIIRKNKNLPKESRERERVCVCV